MKLAENEVLTIVSRLSMLVTPLLFAGYAALFPAWLDGQFASASEFNSLALRVSLAEQRVAGTERNLERLDEIRQELSVLSSRIAVLSSQLNGIGVSEARNR